MVKHFKEAKKFIVGVSYNKLKKIMNLWNKPIMDLIRNLNWT